MPEGLEVEWYRRSAAALVGRTVAGVPVADPLVVDPAVGPALAGRRIDGVGRVGKLLLVDTDGPTVGMHFGMTGRLVVDGMAVVERLAYGSLTDDDVWDRFVVTLTDGGSFRLHDPRRFARVGLEPDIGRLGPDVLGLTRRQLVNALAGRRTTVKAVLLDQHAIAGLGNMLTDEVLWWSGLDPRRAAASLTADEVLALHRAIRRRLPVMLRRGGSHTGTLSPAVRATLPPCPRDGSALRRAPVAGRTTVWCAAHQR